MPVTPRGDAFQAAVTHKGQRYRRQFPTKKAAQVWEAESKAALLRGDPMDTGEGARKLDGLPHTLGQLVEYVFETHWKPMAGGEKALVNARLMAAEIGPSMPIHKITSHAIDKARSKLLESGNAKATVNRKVAALSKMLSVARSLGIIAVVPVMERFKEAQHRIRRFTPQEEATTLRYFEQRSNQDMQDYVALSLDTGLRRGEVLGLRFHNVVDGRVQVFGTHAKSSKSRTVPLTKRAAEILMRRGEGKEGRDIVFPNLNEWAVRHQWERLSETLNLEHDKQFVPHIMRHEFCSRLADRGRSAMEIMVLAGHSSLSVSQRYIHLNGSSLDSAIAALEATPQPVAAPTADIAPS
ncbi:site-specific integrase [Methylobacterium organophilum]|uniref:tyrosine-type recombinase/integrase n=1 Tax=Methylobacterium organophilum TaxID=410 RepID=UPI001F132A2D|nr:site-specific integrase [Methylobacterium organophilum]UMY15627.1 site-specific integrase [Methylobacterium organophilum]